MTGRGRLVQLHRGGVVLDASAPPAWLVREQGAEVVGECLPAVTDDRAWTTLDLGVKVVALR
jgi:PIN domain nuclease of toxin-antitoxin system